MWKTATVTIAKTPVRLHWTILLWLLACWGFTGSLSSALLAFASICLLLLAHELGHATVARFCHLHVIGIEFNAVHGRCLFVTPYRNIELILVAWGGVLAQLLVFVLACALLVLMHVVRPGLAKALDLAPVFIVFTVFNLAGIIQNLVPRKPLDGYLAWQLIPALRSGELRRYFQWRQRQERLRGKEKGGKRD
jgi:stage IV sporulation protein FB